MCFFGTTSARVAFYFMALDFGTSGPVFKNQAMMSDFLEQWTHVQLTALWMYILGLLAALSKTDYVSDFLEQCVRFCGVSAIFKPGYDV